MRRILYKSNEVPHRTKAVKIGDKIIGDGNAIAIQSMTTYLLKDVDNTVKQINQLAQVGCDIIRAAVTDHEDAVACKQVVSQISIPLVCDIHFDYKLAICSMESGAAKIRINPGNIGDKEQVAAICASANHYGCPIRIGVNSGSLETRFLNKHGDTALALSESAVAYADMLESMRFSNIVISVKSQNVRDTVEAYRNISRQCDYPLHLGVTEAGTLQGGVVKSSVALGALLLDGIGDTMRVSLTGDKQQEIMTAIRILSAIGLRKAPDIVSCPTCGRCCMDVPEIAKSVEQALQNENKDICVAVMGCHVNGPKEAKRAHIGVAGCSSGAVLFKKGKTIGFLKHHEIIETLRREIASYG